MFEESIEFSDAIRKYDNICIPTNGETKHNGRAIMGAGIALLARETFHEIDAWLGQGLKVHGNVPIFLGHYQVGGAYYPPSQGVDTSKGRYCRIWSFPTKNLVRDDSDLRLIIASAKLLTWEMTLGLFYVDRFHTVALPRPGCGVGGLRWDDVKVPLGQILDGRFYAIDRPGK
jgi:hypothetical protein